MMSIKYTRDFFSTVSFISKSLFLIVVITTAAAYRILLLTFDKVVIQY